MIFDKSYRSSNFNDRLLPIDMILIHYTGMKSAKEALERLCLPESQVSAHYVIGEDGKIYALVDEDKRAWHAGVSCWKNERDTNSRSIGIELVNPGHEFGYRPFPETQINATVELVKDIVARRNIKPSLILGHSDVAPARKTDPGELFPWSLLAKENLGIWTDAFEETSKSCEEMLQSIGYDVSDLTAALTAFQRHFCPDTLNGGDTERLKKRMAAVTALFKKDDADVSV